MINFEYHRKSSFNQIQAKEKYPVLAEVGLSDESIEARYYLYEYLFQSFGYVGILRKDTHGRPLPINIHGNLYYWSISHSLNYVSYGISDSPIGIDITEHHERDRHLLDIHSDLDYEILGGKNWENFYILWTAKEAIIKQIGGILDDIEHIKLKRKLENGISLFEFHGQSYTIKTIILDSVIFSFTS